MVVHCHGPFFSVRVDALAFTPGRVLDGNVEALGANMRLLVVPCLFLCRRRLREVVHRGRRRLLRLYLNIVDLCGNLVDQVYDILGARGRRALLLWGHGRLLRGRSSHPSRRHLRSRYGLGPRVAGRPRHHISSRHFACNGRGNLRLIHTRRIQAEFDCPDARVEDPSWSRCRKVQEVDFLTHRQRRRSHRRHAHAFLVRRRNAAKILQLSGQLVDAAADAGATRRGGRRRRPGRGRRRCLGRLLDHVQQVDHVVRGQRSGRTVTWLSGCSSWRHHRMHAAASQKRSRDNSRLLTRSLANSHNNASWLGLCARDGQA